MKQRPLADENLDYSLTLAMAPVLDGCTRPCWPRPSHCTSVFVDRLPKLWANTCRYITVEPKPTSLLWFTPLGFKRSIACAIAAALLVLLMIAPAFAQPDQSWVDPPVTSGGGAGQLLTEIQLKRAVAARQLAVDYLDFWSAPNALALEAMPGFYAQRVDFHGRQMSAEALFAEKRRFIRRWPVRSYTARIETLRATCDPVAHTCRVEALFDFTALNPDRGRRSRGAAHLELQVSFAGERPSIVAETSRVVSRGRTRARPLDEVED